MVLDDGWVGDRAANEEVLLDPGDLFLISLENLGCEERSSLNLVNLLNDTMGSLALIKTKLPTFSPNL